MTLRATGQWVGDNRLDLLLAPRAPVAVNRVVGDTGFRALGNVFDEAGSLAFRSGEQSLRARTDRQTMPSVAINASRNQPSGPGIPRLGPAFLAPFVGLRFRLGLRGNRSRGRVSGANRRSNHGQAELHQEKTNLQRAFLNKQVGVLNGQLAHAEHGYKLVIERGSNGRRWGL